MGCWLIGVCQGKTSDHPKHELYPFISCVRIVIDHFDCNNNSVQKVEQFHFIEYFAQYTCLLPRPAWISISLRINFVQRFYLTSLRLAGFLFIYWAISPWTLYSYDISLLIRRRFNCFMVNYRFSIPWTHITNPFETVEAICKYLFS